MNQTFLLIYSQLKTGGVETLIIRMANWLVNNGYTVKILLSKKAELDGLLDPRVKIKYFGWKYFLFNDPFISKLLTKMDFFKGIYVLYSFESNTCWMSTLIHKNLDPKPKFITGVYQPNEYYSSERKKKVFFPTEISKMIKQVIPKDAVLFMNEANKISVEKNLDLQFKDNYFPLPIELPRYLVVNDRQPKKYKIVSIGRLTYFKTYNFTLLNTIKKLKQEYPITYEIYGYGPLENKIIEKIEELDLQENVFFKGKLNYKDLRNVFEDAYLFIGMGTSLIEASAYGVPSIIAIFNNYDTTCYGFFYNQNNYNVGEVVSGLEEVSFSEIIKQAIDWDEDEYQTACKKSVQRAKIFDIDKIMHQFLLLTSNNKSTSLNYFNWFIYEKYFIKYILLKFIKRTFKELIQTVLSK